MAKERNPTWTLRILEKPEEMIEVEELQRLVWPDSETDIIPLHLLVTFAHNGGLVVGAYAGEKKTGLENPASPQVPEQKLIGFVFGFPGLYFTPDGPRPKHCSHELGVHPDYRNAGVGFALKRAQWQMVRHQGLDLITWTFDPLLSHNAYLNITRLGGVCNIYLRELYGDMRDGRNAGLPSDRFQVSWWINTQRVQSRLSKRARRPLDLAHFLSAGAEIINPSQPVPDGFPRPTQLNTFSDGQGNSPKKDNDILLVEIPPDFQALRAADPELSLEWRMHTRALFERLFDKGYLVTDVVHLPGASARSFYVLSHGESTL